MGKVLGKRLRELRKEKKKTLNQVAKELNISLSALAMYERDERIPPTDKLHFLADYYDVSVDYLLGRTDHPQGNVSDYDLATSLTVRNKQKEPKEPASLEEFLQQQEVMFDGVPMTDEEKESVLQALRILWRRHHRKTDSDKQGGNNEK